MSSQISTEEEQGFHEPPGNDFVVDTKRFQTRLLKELICEHMEEESMVTGAQLVFTQKLQQISSNLFFYSYTLVDYGSDFVPRIQEVSWTCENTAYKTSLGKMVKYGLEDNTAMIIVLTLIQRLCAVRVCAQSLSQLFVTPWTVLPARLLCPWNFLGKSTRVGCHALLQGIFPTQGSNPGLPHCRRILCHLRHQGTEFSHLEPCSSRTESLWSLPRLFLPSSSTIYLSVLFWCSFWLFFLCFPSSSSPSSSSLFHSCITSLPQTWVTCATRCCLLTLG